MDNFLRSMEEANLRWALHAYRQARSHRRWAIGQGAVFAAFGLLYIVFVITGSSWFYLISTAIYFIATGFFWHWAWNRWTPLIWKGAREVAEARVRLRRIMEEED